MNDNLTDEQFKNMIEAQERLRGGYKQQERADMIISMAKELILKGHEVATSFYIAKEFVRHADEVLK